MLRIFSRLFENFNFFFGFWIDDILGLEIFSISMPIFFPEDRAYARKKTAPYI